MNDKTIIPCQNICPLNGYATNDVGHECKQWVVKNRCGTQCPWYCMWCGTIFMNDKEEGIAMTEYEKMVELEQRIKILEQKLAYIQLNENGITMHGITIRNNPPKKD